MKNPPPPPEPDPRKKALQILGPAAAVAAIVVLVGVVVGVGNSPTNPTKSGAPAAGGKFDRFPLDGPGWKALDGGLKVWDSTEGTGDPCPPTASVTVHYSGWLTNGSQFDSSRTKGQPITFGLDGVIRGWTLGIPGMKVGGTRRLYIPSALAYGPSGRPGIPPNSDLAFEVEMVSFK